MDSTGAKEEGNIKCGARYIKWDYTNDCKSRPSQKSTEVEQPWVHLYDVLCLSEVLGSISLSL